MDACATPKVYQKKNGSSNEKPSHPGGRGTPHPSPYSRSQKEKIISTSVAFPLERPRDRIAATLSDSV